MALAVLALFTGLAQTELRAEEPRRAIVAMEMVMTGEYVVPHIYGWSYYNKPPFFNWILAGFMHLFGFSEHVVRMPSLIALCLTSLLSFFLTRRWLGAGIAALASFFTLTFADLFFYGTLYGGEIDILYAGLVFAQVMAIFHFHQRGKPHLLFLVSYGFMAIGVLTKGLPSIAFQGLTLVAYAFWSKEWKRLFSWQHLCGILLFLLICGSYFYEFSRREELLPYLVNLYKEAAQRSGLESKWLGLLESTVGFPPQLAKVLLPWSLFALFLLLRKVRKGLMKNPLVGFVLMFLAFNLPLYWFTGELRNRYIYPFFPFFGILLAHIFERGTGTEHKLPVILSKVLKVAVWLLPFVFISAARLDELDVVTGTKTICYALAVALLSLNIPEVKRALPTVWRVLAALLLAKLGMNFLYQPYTQATSNRTVMRGHVSTMQAITENSAVQLTDNPYHFERDASIGPFHFQKVTLTCAPPYNFKLPYYFNRANGQRMTFSPNLKSGEFYVGEVRYFNNADLWGNLEEHYRYFDPSNKEEFVLVTAIEDWVNPNQ